MPKRADRYRVVRLSVRETTAISLAVPPDVDDETVRRLVEARWNGTQFDTYRQQRHSTGTAVTLGIDLIERDVLLEDAPAETPTVRPVAARQFWDLVITQILPEATP